MEIERINEYQDECFPQAVKEEEKKVRKKRIKEKPKWKLKE